MKEYIKPLAEVVEFESKDDVMASTLSYEEGAEIW